MRMERRGTRRADQLKLMPEPCTDGAFKGYIGIDWISSAARRLGEGERTNNVMHHFHTDNLRQAFRQLDGSKAVGIDLDLTTGLGTQLKRKPRSRVRKLRTHGSMRSSGRQRPLFT